MFVTNDLTPWRVGNGNYYFAPLELGVYDKVMHSRKNNETRVTVTCGDGIVYWSFY